MLQDFVDSGSFARSFMAGTVHMRFIKATRQLGLPEIAQPIFVNEIISHLRNADHASSWDKNFLIKLWHAVHQGEVIATDVWDGAPVFYIRAGYQHTGLVARLIFRDNGWHIESVISLYERTIRRAPWFRRSASIIIMLLAVGVGFSLHQGTPSTNAASLSAQGSTTAPASTVPTHSTSVLKAHAATSAVLAATASLAKPHTLVQAKVHTTAVPKITVYHFNLALGMPLFNLAQFLANHHLVSSAIGFDMTMKNTGVDQHVQPGTYTFHTGMSVKQLLNVLRHGPTS